jgi:hypothetical protein
MCLDNEPRPASNGDMCSHGGCNMARETRASNQSLRLLEMFLCDDLLADIFVEFHGCGELQCKVRLLLTTKGGRLRGVR